LSFENRERRLESPHLINSNSNDILEVISILDTKSSKNTDFELKSMYLINSHLVMQKKCLVLWKRYLLNIIFQQLMN